MNKKKGKHVWKGFIQFYTRFKIPWWLFAISMLLGIAYTELTLRLSQFMISFNKGELYNSAILGYALLTVLNSLIILAQNMGNEYGSQKITLRAREVLWRKILHMPVRQFEKEQPSSLVSGVTVSVAQASKAIVTLSLLIASVYGFVKSFVILWRYNGTLTAYLLLLVPLAVFVFFIVGRLEYKMQKKNYYATKTMTEFFSEHLSNAKHVKVQAVEEREIEEGYKAINKQYAAGVYYAFMIAVQTFTNSLYTSFCTVFMAVGGSALIVKKQMESTGITTFNTYMTNVNRYLAEILTTYQTLKGVQGGLDHANRIFEMNEEDMQNGGEVSASHSEKDIVFENVSFGYDPENEVLHNLTFSIPCGKTTAIVGDNGCGKSTLLKLLLRFYEPTGGKIRIGENDISGCRLQPFRQQFAYVQQGSPLFSGTVRTNIVYGLKYEASDAEVTQAAASAQAHEFVEALPYGYDTDIGEDGRRLSGGQRQRIAIARAMIHKPAYLLLDEAGANLDYQSNDAVRRAICELMKEKTIVLIAHDMQEVVGADKIIVLHAGYLEAEGTHHELLTISPTYKEYIERESAGKEEVS